MFIARPASGSRMAATKTSMAHSRAGSRLMRLLSRWFQARLAKGRKVVENVLMRKFPFFLAAFVFLAASPAFFPGGRAAEAGEIVRFVIDPGHGGYDTGIRVADVREKEITLALARNIQEILESLERDVVLTRKMDQYLSIEERRAVADQSEPELFLSLHLSDSDTFAVYVMWYEKNDDAMSVRDYYAVSSRQKRYLHDSGDLSSVMAKTLKGEFGKGVFQRKMPLSVLGSIGAPAVVIEAPSRGIDYGREMQRVAGSIVLGLLRYENRGKD